MLGVAAMVLASCTNEEVLNISDSRAIGFNGTGIDNITKADITSEHFDHFYVYGGYAKGTVFNGKEVSKGKDGWSYSPAEYWANGTWNFAGYEGGDGVTDVTWNNTEGKLTFLVNSDASHQSDVVYAEHKSITVEDATSYSESVSLQFKHLLSKIQFKFAKDAATLGSQSVKLTNFSVSGITTNAKWVAGTQNNADVPATGSYNDFSGEGATIDNDESTTVATSAFYVIPQNIGTFNITAKAEIIDVNGTTIKSGDVKATVPATDITKWDAQNVYVYTATLKYENIIPEQPDKDPKPIEFEGTAKDWNSEQSGTITPSNK